MGLSDAERAAGLSQPLPEGEAILWQAKPDAELLTRHVFHLRWVHSWFACAAVAVIVLALHAGRSLGQGVAEVTLLVPFDLIGTGLLMLLGRMTARASTYTLTNRRLILHIGIAFEMTVSVPLSAIRSAALRRNGAGRGDIVLSVKDAGGANYVGLWPHARPWRFSPPQPMLRALPDVEDAAERIGDALALFKAARAQAGTVAGNRPAPGHASFQTVAAA